MPQTKRGLNDGSQGGSAVPTGSISQKKLKWDSHLDVGGPSWIHKETLYCPVPSCPKSNTSTSGWIRMQSLRRHLKEHQGRLPGAIPTEFLDYHNLKSCPICGYIIAQSLNSCRKCAPAYRAAANPNRSDTPATDALPSLDEICTTRVRLFKHVPKRARALWGEVLAKAIANAVYHNMAQAWTELLMLPKCVLLTPPRQGKSNKHTSTAFIRLRYDR